MPFMTQAGRITRENVPRLPDIAVPYKAENKTYTVYVLEHPPARVGIVFKQKRKTQKGTWSKMPATVYRYKINVPWCYFLMRANKAGAITDTFLFFAPSKLLDVNGRVYLPLLPNIYPSAHICNGTIRVNFEDPPLVKIVEAFRSFWSTPFTEETWTEDRNLIPPCFHSCESNGYMIEYGWLRYIFEYWINHDVYCVGQNSHPWGWKPFRPRSKGGHYGGFIETLDGIMQYALNFDVKNHVPNNE